MFLELLRKNIIAGLLKKGPTTSPVKRWLQTDQVSQSQSIRFGTLWEDTLNEYVKSSSGYDAITLPRCKTFITAESKLTRKSKGAKDVDILFRRGNVIFYRESKCNLLLDSEKSKATADKIRLVSQRLQQLYPNCSIDAAVLSMDWSGAAESLWGVPLEYTGAFLQRLGIEKITEADYIEYGKILGEELLSHAANS